MIVDPLPVAEVVADRFGWAPPRSMVLAGEGAMGRIWRLDTETGTYAVKELYWASDLAVEEAAVARQVPFCNLARAAGIVAPGSLRTESGRYVIALPEELCRRLIRAYEWIDGRTLTMDDGAADWAGRTEAIIEGLAVPGGDQELDPWGYRSPSAEEWAALADRCQAAGQPWAGALRQSIPHFVALPEWVRPHDPDDLILTHTDFQRHNVMVDRTGRFVLLDWDDAGPSMPSRALGRLLNNWHIDGTAVDHEGIKQTVRGYRAAGGTAKISEVADFGDSICGYLNYVYSQAGLSLDRWQPEQLWTEAGHRVSGLVDNPPQLATYEAAVRSATVG
jgi:Ser/Thr protein kinase RdoA (MazF antagonist)